MTPRAQPAERLEKRLARVSREQGLDQERLRRWVSFLALCGVLERAIGEGILDSYFLKGGVALELRFARQARATKDLDLGLQGPRGSRVALLGRALAPGFDAFTFRVKAAVREMEQADTVRVNVAVAYRTRAWQTIEIDLGPAAGQSIDLVDPQVAGLAELGVPVASPIRCLGLAEQVAQKLHACTSPQASGRARDVLDILLIDTLQSLDYRRTAGAAKHVFAIRATHPYPPDILFRPEWRPELEATAAALGFAEPDAGAIEKRFRSLVQRIVDAG